MAGLTKVGSSGIDLADNFAFTGTVTGTPNDFVRISTTTITSAVATAVFTTISDDYDIYMVQGRNIQLTADGKIKCRVGTSSSYVTGNYRVAGTSGRTSSAAIDKDDKFTDSTFDLTGGWTVWGSTNATWNGNVYFYNLRATTGAKHIYANASFVQNNDYTVFGNWAGRLPSTDQYTHLQFGDLTGAANMDYGVWTLYGLKQ